jgi:hypothetical protein
MKRQLLAGALLAMAFTTNAQITLENTYTNADVVQVVSLKLSGKKYCVRDLDAGQVRLYNLTHTIWKTINVPTIPGFTLTNSYVGYVSENLFKIDNKVNLVVRYSNDTSSIYSMVVIDEAGAVTKRFDSTTTLVVSNTGVNRFVAIADEGSASTKVKVYLLPGTIPCNQCSDGTLGLSKSPEVSSGDLSDAIPNPNSGQARIDYSLPDGVNRGQIVVYNTNGQRVGSYDVDKTFNYITVDNTMLPSGIYYYTLIANGMPSTTKKMVVIQ